MFIKIIYHFVFNEVLNHFFNAIFLSIFNSIFKNLLFYETLLRYLCKIGNIELVKYFISKNVIDVNSKDFQIIIICILMGFLTFFFLLFNFILYMRIK